MKIFYRVLMFILLLAMIFSLTACGGAGENEGEPNTPVSPGDTVEILPGFDYTTVDLSQYISFGDWNYHDMSITISEIAAITEETVNKEFNSYFNDKNNPYYQEVSDPNKAVAEGDTVYMMYTGVMLSVLEKAVSDGKISDVRCTGMRYSDILSLQLGFSGGTTSSVVGLKIGSNSYINGFESGLVGYAPSTSGEENPVRLELSFPDSYGNADLAGQRVIFFCKLIYIGDEAAGAYTADTISVERVNEIINLSGDSAYDSIEACLAQIKKGLEDSREQALYNAKADAIFKVLAGNADIPYVPDEMLTAYVKSVLSGYLYDLLELYYQYPSYYASKFGSNKPTEELVAAYLGYQGQDYMAKMKEDAIPAVKNEMIFWYFVDIEGITLTKEEIAKRREEYMALYGETVFAGYDEKAILEQFLRDKFVGNLIEELENNEAVIYTPAEGN